MTMNNELEKVWKEVLLESTALAFACKDWEKPHNFCQYSWILSISNMNEMDQPPNCDTGI
jgi:hypothetical protein